MIEIDEIFKILRARGPSVSGRLYVIRASPSYDPRTMALISPAMMNTFGQVSEQMFLHNFI